jgi:hypothetical protein
MADAKLQSWWSHKQGLDGSLTGRTAAQILEATGWARTVGGAGGYLGLFARAGLSRETVDAALAALEIHELPSARGCTYLLPASDFALGLRAAQAFAGGEMKVAAKLGVTEGEVDKLCDAVLSALKTGPLDPDGLKDAVGPAARSLGPEGTKKGISSTMPLALGKLQVSGDIRRVPVNGRLDQQRYRYTLWKPNPLSKFQIPAEEVNVEIARRYFRWIGPATLAEFQWHSGLGVKPAKAALEPLKLVPFDLSSERLLFAEDREAFERFRAPKKPEYVLTGNLDGIALLRRDLKGLLADEDLGREAMVERGPKALSELAGLPSPAIFDRGRIAGLWEYDVSTASVAWMAFAKPDKALKEAVARMEAFVRDQLGDARMFSLDSPKSRAPRVEALRKANPGV